MPDTNPLPCPVCGELPIITKHFREEAWGLVHRCEAWGSIIFEFTDRERQVKRWNTRALTPKQKAAEGLENALKHIAFEPLTDDMEADAVSCLAEVVRVAIDALAAYEKAGQQ